MPNPFAQSIGVGTLLSERLFPLAALHAEGAVRIHILNAFDDKSEFAVRIVIRIFGSDDFLGLPGSSVLAVPFRRRLARQRLTCLYKIAVVEKLH